MEYLDDDGWTIIECDDETITYEKNNPSYWVRP